VRDREEWKEGENAATVFYGGGYAPVTMQMLMVRYWATHGSPGSSIYPEGRGFGGSSRAAGQNFVWRKGETLQRYLVEGLIWGREWLWFNAKQDLIAAVTTDAEFRSF